jgi:hypothetical protein
LICVLKIPEKNKSLNLEQELVIACISLGQGKDERIQELLTHEINWQNLSQIALHQGVFPLFYLLLKAAAERQIPPESATLFDQRLHSIAQNNIRLTWKLIQLTELLSSQAVEFLVLKGPVFALQAFGDLALRQFTDLDILIHPEDFSEVYELLCQYGYTPIFELGSTQKSLQVQTDNHFTFKRQGDVIEVHWKIAPQENIYPIKPEQIWQELNSVSLLEREIPTPSPENTILFACLHGAKHGWRQLKWIVDLAYLSQTFNNIDWQALFELSKKLGLYRQVCLGLLLAEELVDANLPVKVWDSIHTEQSAQRLAAKVQGRLFDKANVPSQFEDYSFYLQTRERWRDRFYYLFNMTFVPRRDDLLNLTLPEALYPVYYVYRPLRLSFMIGRVAFNAITKR